MKSLQINKVIIIVASVFLLTYIMLRAYLLSFTHDESLSLYIVDGKFIFADTANNHLLNTKLMDIFKKCFGRKEFSLRLPNVLSFITYSISCFYILKTSRKLWFTIFGLALILFNPFMLEYFSLARGYGISLGFMLLSVYFLLKDGMCTPNPSTLMKDFFLSSIFGALALFANLALINFYICVLVIFFIKYLIFKNQIKKFSSFDLKYLGVFGLSIIPLILGMGRLLKLKVLNELYFGSNSFSESFNSIFSSSLYISKYFETVVFIIFLIFLINLITGIIYIVGKKKYKSSLFILTLLILMLIFGSWIENLIFEAKYPSERTGLYYLPIIATFTYFLFRDLIEEFKIKRIIYLPILMAAIVFILINCCFGFNLSHTKSWRFDAHTKEMMKLVKINTKFKNEKYTISNDWLFEPSINYYIHYWDINLNYANRDGVNTNSDFIYQLNYEIIPPEYKILKSFSDNQCLLLIKKENN